jgi:hypothetical protein
MSEPLSNHEDGALLATRDRGQETALRRGENPMQNATYLGITRLRYVQCTHDKGRPYYYFRRRRFPIVRLPGEPGSELFMSVYNSALASKSREQFTALRSNMEQQGPRDVELSPLATAILAWAERKPITRSQANMVAKRFGVAIEEIMRGREIVDQDFKPVTSSPEDGNEARELSKAQEILGMVLPTDQDSALALHPSEEASQRGV